MKFKTSSEFRRQERMQITIMGMSNMGKTACASMFPSKEWFHYSVDFRLATRHLREQLIDFVKKEMMSKEHLSHLLREDSISIDLNVSFRNLGVVSRYLGKFGNPAEGGLSWNEFSFRQRMHRDAEIKAIQDVPDFLSRAMDIYGYPHFINDTGGSLCEIIDPYDDEDHLLRVILDNSVLIYIQPSAEHETELVRRAQSHPKPLYYRPEFFVESVDTYLAEVGLAGSDKINPDEFVRWVFPRLLAHRRPRYERIARHGYVISAADVARVKTHHEFLDLISSAIDAVPFSEGTQIQVPPYGATEQGWMHISEGAS